MQSASYLTRRGQLETYFDRTAVDAWSRLTSDAPVSRIRATVRAGRDEMRRTLLAWLPRDLTGRRLLDAGCGTGALAVEAARRGAQVVAVDLSPTLIDLARERAPRDLGGGDVQFLAGDMLDPALGQFDHVVAMDSLIHYRVGDALRALAALGARVKHNMLFTFAPRTPSLALMHGFGRLFPKGHRSPEIEPVGENEIRQRLATDPEFGRWSPGRTQRIASGFYTSQAQELVGR